AARSLGPSIRMSFELQGHRGARGLKPENTLPSFEVALDWGVDSIETDVHLTRDNVPVLAHDPCLNPALTRPLHNAGGVASVKPLLIRELTLGQLRGYRADRNPDPTRFPVQEASITPLAQWFADHYWQDPYTVPTLADLLAFVSAYAGQ